MASHMSVMISDNRPARAELGRFGGRSPIGHLDEARALGAQDNAQDNARNNPAPGGYPGPDDRGGEHSGASRAERRWAGVGNLYNRAGADFVAAVFAPSGKRQLCQCNTAPEPASSSGATAPVCVGRFYSRRCQRQRSGAKVTIYQRLIMIGTEVALSFKVKRVTVNRCASRREERL